MRRRKQPTMGELGFTSEFRIKDDDEDQDPMEDSPPDDVPGVHRYWGKYRGVVRVPIDPEGRGRLMVSCENVCSRRVQILFTTRTKTYSPNGL